MFGLGHQNTYKYTNDLGVFTQVEGFSDQIWRTRRSANPNARRPFGYQRGRRPR